MSTSTKEEKPKASSLPRWLRGWLKVVDKVTSDLFGGPRCIRLAHVINFQKGSTLVMCVAMMIKSRNFSATATTYTALHGSYGLCWLLKHFVFPDPKWDAKVTVGSALASFACVLGPYWVIAYNAIVGHAERSNVQLCAATVVYALGLTLMMGADCQKYFVLQKEKGLITNGFFARTRNPNYLGEVMIYGAFGYVSQNPVSWMILGTIWGGAFLPFMLQKDERMSRHAGFAAYKKRTGLFFPSIKS